MTEEMKKTEEQQAHDAHLNHLTDVANHTLGGYSILKLTDEDVAKVALNCMLTAFAHGYENMDIATRKMQEFVDRFCQAIRNDEATKIILPPSAMEH